MLKNKFKKSFYKNFEDLKIKAYNNTLFADKSVERETLALILTDDEKQHLGCDYLDIDDFFIPEHKQLFDLIKYKRSKSSPHPTFYGYIELTETLESDVSLRNRYSLVNEALLSSLSTQFNNQSNFNYNVEKLIELTRLRALEVFYGESLQAFKTNNEISWENSLNDFETFIITHNERGLKNSSFISLNDATDIFIEKLEQMIQSGDVDAASVFSGFDAIDQYTKGFKPGQFVVLGARPGVGKTALALNIAKNITKDPNKSCAFISLEMPVHELVSRFYASISNIELNKLQNPKFLKHDDFMKLRNIAAITKEQSNLYFDDVATSKIQDIIWKIKQLNKDLNGGLSFVIVDYLQLVSSDGHGGNRNTEVSAISRSLKTMALDLKIPIMALSQLTRNVENREDKRPQLIDLRESGSIEQDADIVIFLSRTILDKKKNQNSNDITDEYKLTEVTIAKNRNGSPGYAELLYEGRIVTFKEHEFRKDE
ncbi:DnaB-like helicase C-terminal domain-containing protein [Mycoplasma sp. AC1221]